MIAPPRRAVTRFFIPMIDVLILLFCIFLLMPFVSTPDATPDTAANADPSKPTTIEQLQQELAIAKRRIESMKAERANLFDRYQVKVLEIDEQTGKLFSFETAAAARRELTGRADAERMIQEERGRAGAKDVCFLILYPRDLTGFPLREQVDAYRQWFRDVPHAFDNPWAER